VPQLCAGRVEVRYVRALVECRDLECRACARRRLFEDEGDRPAVEAPHLRTRIFGPLKRVRELQEEPQLVWFEVYLLDEASVSQAERHSFAPSGSECRLAFEGEVMRTFAGWLPAVISPRRRSALPPSATTTLMRKSPDPKQTFMRPTRRHQSPCPCSSTQASGWEGTTQPWVDCASGRATAGPVPLA
jgi:hypothetical protein